ncbi:MAG TPA: hypothetical protein VN886_19050, partial [Acidimicrobiales bacterium]|nr:hypothetical protein [Acidimicrobiales bacterium]
MFTGGVDRAALAGGRVDRAGVARGRVDRAGPAGGRVDGAVKTRGHPGGPVPCGTMASGSLALRMRAIASNRGWGWPVLSGVVA